MSDVIIIIIIVLISVFLTIFGLVSLDVYKQNNNIVEKFGGTYTDLFDKNKYKSSRDLTEMKNDLNTPNDVLPRRVPRLVNDFTMDSEAEPAKITPYWKQAFQHAREYLGEINYFLYDENCFSGYTGNIDSSNTRSTTTNANIQNILQPSYDSYNTLSTEVSRFPSFGASKEIVFTEPSVRSIPGYVEEDHKDQPFTDQF